MQEIPMMRYPPELTEPMRKELVQLGVEELRTPEQVDEALANRSGTTLVFVNSVCGCAAGMARPGLALAMRHDRLPDRITTVFAGVDTAATQKVRGYFDDYPPSSPQVALFRDGRLVQLIQRHQIEGTSPEAVAEKLTSAFDAHCAPAS
jgi:putative YphP/YqiW family bacilliredoxin